MNTKAINRKHTPHTTQLRYIIGTTDYTTMNSFTRSNTQSHRSSSSRMTAGNSGHHSSRVSDSVHREMQLRDQPASHVSSRPHRSHAPPPSSYYNNGSHSHVSRRSSSSNAPPEYYTQVVTPADVGSGRRSSVSHSSRSQYEPSASHTSRRGSVSQARSHVTERTLRPEDSASRVTSHRDSGMQMTRRPSMSLAPPSYMSGASSFRLGRSSSRHTGMSDLDSAFGGLSSRGRRGSVARAVNVEITSEVVRITID